MTLCKSLFGVVLYISACGGSPPVVSEASTPAVGDPVAQNHETPPSFVPSNESLQAWAQGSGELNLFVRIEWGIGRLVFMSSDAQDPDADPDGIIRMRRRVCGDELMPSAQDLRDALSSVYNSWDEGLAQEMSRPVPFSCRELEAGIQCYWPGYGHPASSIALRFERSGDAWMLNTWTEAESGMLSAEFEEEISAWVAENLEPVSNERCLGATTL